MTQIDEDAFLFYPDEDLFSKQASSEEANINRVNDVITDEMLEGCVC